MKWGRRKGGKWREGTKKIVRFVRNRYIKLKVK
jgi:hypothetical protein